MVHLKPSLLDAKAQSRKEEKAINNIFFYNIIARTINIIEKYQEIVKGNIKSLIHDC